MSKSTTLATALVFLTVSLFLFQLNATHLTNWDEAWHAVIARNMARSGDFITPIYNGQVWFATAPLYLWALAIWFQLTNYSLIGIRLFSALAGIGTVFLTYLIGKKLDNKSTGLVAAFILATTIQFLFRARQGNLDAPLAFFNTFAVYSFLKGKSHQNWYLGIGIATALGFLTKSVLGLFPLLLFFFIPKRSALKSLSLSLAIILPWHLAAYLAHGQSFINQYFLQYTLSKATNANPVSGTDVFWYLGVLKHGLKIWILFFIPSLIYSAYELCTGIFKKTSQGQSVKKNFPLFAKEGARESIKNDVRRLMLPLAWVLLPFTLLTLARMRNDWYLISLYPAIALVIAFFINWLINQLPKLSKLIIIGLIVAGLINAVKYKDSYIVPETTAAEVKLATMAKELSSPNEPIILDDNYLPVALFYTDRPVIPLRYSRTFQSLVGESSLKQATTSATLILTNTQTIDQFLQSTHVTNYQILATADDKLLIQLQ